MDNLEDIAGGGRVTRSLRKRLTSIDSSDTAGSRPTTPIAQVQKLATITELNSPSRRITRRNSITQTATPAKAVPETAVTPARRSTRKRSVSISEETPKKATSSKPIVAQPKFDTLTEEEPRPRTRRSTRSESKSPQEATVDKTARDGKVLSSHKNKPRISHLADSDSDVEIINLEEEEEEAKNVSAIEKPNQTKELEKSVETPKEKSAKIETKEVTPVTKSKSPFGSTLEAGKIKHQSPRVMLKNISHTSYATPKKTPVRESPQEKEKELSTSIAKENEKVSTSKVSSPKVAKAKKDENEVVEKTEEKNSEPEASANTSSNCSQHDTSDLKLEISNIDDEALQTPEKLNISVTSSSKESATKSERVEIIKVQRLTPKMITQLSSSKTENANDSLPVKSVNFNDSDMHDSTVKSVYPKTPGLTKSKSYIDMDSSKEAEDKSFQSEKGSVASFKDAREEVEIASGRSSRLDERDASKDGSMEYHDASNVPEPDHEVEIQEDITLSKIWHEKTPYKTNLMRSHASSTPVIFNDEDKSDQVHKRASMEAVSEQQQPEDMDISMDDSEKSLRSGKKYGDSPQSIKNSPRKRKQSGNEEKLNKSANKEESLNAEDRVESADNDKSNLKSATASPETAISSTEPVNNESKKTSLYASSWSQGIKGKANESTKIDTIESINTPEKSVTKTETPSSAKKPRTSSVGDDKVKAHNVESENEEDESMERMELIDDEAIEAHESYCSGDSLTHEERQEIEENEVVELGESIGSDDTVESIDDADEEADEENASFITTDSEEELLEYSDDDEHVYESPKKSNEKKKAYKRIRNVSNSSVEGEIATRVDMNNSKEKKAFSRDVSKMIDDTIREEEEQIEVNDEEEVEQVKSVKKRHSLNGSQTKSEVNVDKEKVKQTAAADESEDKRDNLNTSKKRKSLNKSKTDTSMNEKLEKSFDLLKSPLGKEILNTNDIQVLTYERKSLGKNDSTATQKVANKSQNGTQSGSSSCSENETEDRADNVKKTTRLSVSLPARKPSADDDETSSSDYENNVLSMSQNLRMQRAEVYESSDDESDELEKEPRRSLNKSLNKSKVHETEVAESLNSTPGQKRKSLNNSLSGKAESDKKKCLSSSLRKAAESEHSSSDEGDVDADEHKTADKDKSNSRNSLYSSYNASLRQADELKNESMKDNVAGISQANINHQNDDTETESSDHENVNNKNNVTQANPSEETENEDDDDEDNEGDDDAADELSLVTTKSKKAAAGLSVSFGQLKDIKKKAAVMGKIKHSSFTIGFTVKKDAFDAPEQSTNSSEDSAVAEAQELLKPDSPAETSKSSQNEAEFSSDEMEQLEELAEIKELHKMSKDKNRHSLACTQSNATVKENKRSSLAQVKGGAQPSKSFLEVLEKRKSTLKHDADAKAKRLSKSFSAVEMAKEEKLKLGSKEEEATEMGSLKPTLSTSTPREQKMKSKRMDIAEILGRCDEILEAANQAKLEQKQNFKKSKVKMPKKMKEHRHERQEETVQDFEPIVKENSSKKKEELKVALEQALKTSANMLLKTKTPHMNKEEKKVDKRLPMQLLEAISNAEPASTMKRNKDSERSVTSKRINALTSTAGNVIEELATPPRKKTKMTTVNKFEIPSGIVYEEPLTPKREKTIAGEFRVSPVTPRTIGSKVRTILTAGQDMPPSLPSNQSQSRKERKSKRAIVEPQMILPKPKWTSSGEFVEEQLTTPRTIARTDATEFLVAALHEAKKEKSKKSAVNSALANALNFKKTVLSRENLPRESSHEAMLRKQRRRAHNQF